MKDVRYSVIPNLMGLAGVLILILFVAFLLWPFLAHREPESPEVARQIRRGQELDAREEARRSLDPEIRQARERAAQASARWALEEGARVREEKALREREENAREYERAYTSCAQKADKMAEERRRQMNPVTRGAVEAFIEQCIKDIDASRCRWFDEATSERCRKRW